MAEDLSILTRAIARTRTRARCGAVCGAGPATLHVTGLGKYAGVGDQIAVETLPRPLEGEIVALRADLAEVMPYGSTAGIPVGAIARLESPARLAPDPSWRGRIIDPFGRPLDGRALAGGAEPVPLRRAPPPAARRKPLGERLHSGIAAIDTMLPIVRGQRIGLFAGSGVGKTTLLASLASSLPCDTVVLALIGERGRELRHFTEVALGPEGLGRCVVVTATSDQPAPVKRRAAWAAMAVAEQLRDQGQHVLFLCDSVTRFAEAHREIALASGETPSLRAYPPSTASLIAELAERAGPGAEGTGDITAVFSVLVAGSDMEEPIADILRGVLDGHVLLDREIAERGRFPAIDVRRSVSRSLPAAALSTENTLIARARQILAEYQAIRPMVQAGLFVAGADALADRAVALWPQLDAFFAETATADIATSFERLAGILDRA